MHLVYEHRKGTLQTRPEKVAITQTTLDVHYNGITQHFSPETLCYIARRSARNPQQQNKTLSHSMNSKWNATLHPCSM